MKRCAFILVVAFIGKSAFAEGNKADCAALAPSMLQASDALAGLSNSLLGVDYSQMESRFTGPEAEAFRELAKAQEKMKPELDAFLARMEEAALLMRQCAR